MKILTRKLGWRGVSLLLGILPIVLVGMYCLVPIAGRLLSNRRPWEPRAQLFAFFVELDLRAEPEYVEELIQSGRYPLLGHPQYSSRDAGVLVIATPFEWDAHNWVLYLQFDKGLLVAKRIRIQDTVRVHPSGAPDDEVAQADVPCPSWLEIRRE